MKILITESKLERVVINWLNDNYGDLESYETERYENLTYFMKDLIFFMKDDKVIFTYNKKDGSVTISYNEIWTFFESYFSMKYEQIQDLTKLWVMSRYNLEVSEVYPANAGLENNSWKNITN
jgi:uncharacterized protein YfkK (UPF0435 family)